MRFWAIADPDHLVHAGRQLVIRALVPAEDLDVDDLAVDTVRHAQRGVFHFARLLTEDRAQQSLFRTQFRLTPRRDLADQNVVRANLGADADDPVLVEVRQALLADVRDVAGDLFRTQLGVARFGLVLLDVDRGEDVVAHQPLADQDGVLEVAAFPGHERDEHVLTERQLAILGRRRIGHDLPDLDPVALADAGPLVDAGVLIRADELPQAVDVLAAVVVRRC